MAGSEPGIEFQGQGNVEARQLERFGQQLCRLFKPAHQRVAVSIDPFRGMRSIAPTGQIGMQSLPDRWRRLAQIAERGCHKPFGRPTIVNQQAKHLHLLETDQLGSRPQLAQQLLHLERLEMCFTKTFTTVAHFSQGHPHPRFFAQYPADNLRGQGLPVDALLRENKAVLDGVSARYSREFNIALTSAFEHFTGLLAETFFSHRETTQGMDNRI